MKLFVSIVLLSAFLYQTGSKLVILINFKINQDYIAKNLCVKKEIVDNDCEGNCCLKESLEEEEESENPSPNLPKEKSETFMFTGVYDWTPRLNIIISENNIRNDNPPITPFTNLVFHPPPHL